MKKRIIRLFRTIFNVRKNETIRDFFIRRKLNFLRLFYRKSYTKKDFEQALIKLGIKSGDVVIVHSSWRSFWKFQGTANDVIDIILKIIGEKGVLLMPEYTASKDMFSYYDNSNAGYISEIFRTNYDSKRSLNSYFSMSAIGKNADYYIDSHIDSSYHLDEMSPYFKAIENNAKILLLGLGKKPHKITLFHCVTYQLRNKVDFYKEVYKKTEDVVLIDKNNKKYKKRIINRLNNYQNNNYKFKKLFLILKKYSKYYKLNMLDIYCLDSKAYYDNAKQYIIDNNYIIYKK